MGNHPRPKAPKTEPKPNPKRKNPGPAPTVGSWHWEAKTCNQVKNATNCYDIILAWFLSSSQSPFVLPGHSGSCTPTKASVEDHFNYIVLHNENPRCRSPQHMVSISPPATHIRVTERNVRKQLGEEGGCCFSHHLFSIFA